MFSFFHSPQCFILHPTSAKLEYLRDCDGYNEFKKYRFHIALMLRYIAVNKNAPRSNSKDMRKICDELYSKLIDLNWLTDGISRCCTIIKEIISNGNIKAKDGNDIIRTREFTTELLSKITSIKSMSYADEETPLGKGDIVCCKVLSWNKSFVNVELLDHSENGSIHISNIADVYVSNIGDLLKVGQTIDAIILEDAPHPDFGYSLSIKGALNSSKS